TGGREPHRPEASPDAPLPADAETREELALALGLLDDGGPSPGLLEALVEDADPRVARAALLSVGRLRRDGLVPKMLAALAEPELRERAREALVRQGPPVEEALEDWLRDPAREASVRRQIPGVLARIPRQEAVDTLLRWLGEARDDRVVEVRSVKALSKLRSRSSPSGDEPDDDALVFERPAVLAVMRREVAEARRYAALRRALTGSDTDASGRRLLARALDEAWEECQELVFRCLGLAFPPERVYRAYVAVTRGDERVRANAVEWLDESLGHTIFHEIEPVLERRPTGSRDEGDVRGAETLEDLTRDRRPWLAEVAAWALNPHRGTDDGDRAGPGAVEDAPAADRGPDRGAREGMDRIEKVFLLQKVDLLEEARSSHLALLASIAEEVEVAEGEVLIRQGETNEALYVLIRGSVELRGMGDQVMVARENTPFGTWALIDSDPSVVGARAAEPSRLLRITRSDFHDLLADHPELAMGMLQGLARRLRSLVA
ncbi:MAG TPA: cyclic nucleotide-binding domain-containing protein, partial [Longimicrobiales bacterium]|nr:cyclic nucleotide-binding domain-containing protein [Longimicrobiales bacterium]